MVSEKTKLNFLILLLKAFCGVRSDNEETVLQKLLQDIMLRIVASFPVQNPNAHPTPPQDNLDVENPYSSFPAHPIIRFPRLYPADAGGQETTEEFCHKNAYVHNSLHPGDYNRYQFK